MENNDLNSAEERAENESHLINQLEKKLYSREGEIKQKERTVLHPKKISQTESWGGSLEYKKPVEKVEPSPFVKFFFFSIVFFLIAIAIAGYSLFSKRIVVSPNNVNIEVSGPVSLKGGDELSVQVMIENKNTVALNNVKITTDFPIGSKYVSNPGETLTRTVKTLEDINPGELRTETVKALILGQENDTKDINFTVQYSIEGGSAVFTKTKKFTLTLTNPPLSFTTTMLKETIPGQDFIVGVDIKSNSAAVVKDSLIKITYPTGYVFKKAVPPPSFGNNVWALGDLSLGDEKQIQITGTLLGESDQSKVFHVFAGSGSSGDPLTLGTLYADSQSTVTIKKPFLGIVTLVNNFNSENAVINANKQVEIDLQWMNSLTNKIIENQIEVSITGNIIDKNTVIPQMDGLYDSLKNTIFWDKRVISSLSSLAPGEKGTAKFLFSLKPFTSENIYKNPEITVTTRVQGKRIDENNVPDAVTFSSEKKIKVETLLGISSYGTYFGDPFANTGPIPPQVGNETTYTINWKVINTSNDVSNAVVTATLPVAVRFTGKIFPTGAPLTYNAVNHTITWKIGSIPSATGYAENEAEMVAFQVALLPGLSQVQTRPTLLSSAVITGTDKFTNTELSVTSADVTTVITKTDPGVGNEGTKVVP